MRANSLCGICSGRSQAFFKQDKILVKEDTCGEVMTHCGKHFSLVVRFIKRVSMLIDSLHEEILNEKKEFSDLVLDNIRNVSRLSRSLKKTAW